MRLFALAIMAAMLIAAGLSTMAEEAANRGEPGALEASARE
jgi:hypothetical protein